MTACPPRDRLALLLTEQLVEPEAGRVEAHLETCRGCQGVVAELSGPEPATPRQGATRPPRPRPRPEFLRRLRETPPAAAGDAFPTPSVRSSVAAKVLNGAGRPAQWPQVVGYDVLGEVGRGGIAVVYRARHQALGRVVALKMILTGAHASPNERARFRAEAEAVARLQHPNIVQIFDVGEHDGCPYLALEYVAGGTLAQHLQGRPLPARQAAELTESLARAVQHAHDHGIVHRDLKPANVLLQIADCRLQIANLKSAISNLQSPIPKVADFGLAKYLGADAGRTQTGHILGTPSYMAPEQAAGRGRDIGPAADVYALGVTLYEMLTGRPPFRGESMADTLQQVQFGEPVPPSRLQPHVPRDLQTVCLRCLEKQPGRRYASALALADDLRRFRAGEPVLARPTPPWERARKWARRSPARAALAGVSAAALLILLLGGGWFTQALREEAAEARRQRQAAVEQGEKARDQEAIARRERDKARTEAVAARRLVYAADVRRAYQALRDGHNLGRVLEVLIPYDGGRNNPDELRGWEWYYLTGLCHRGLTIYNPRDGAGGLSDVTVSPDGRWIVGADTRRGVYVWSARTSGLWAPDRRLDVPAAQALAATFSPDSRFLASSGGGRILIWSTTDWKPTDSWVGHKGRVLGLAFSPDGRWLASAGEEGTAKVWPFRDGRVVQTAGLDPKPARILRGHAGPVRGVAFSPDGRQLASAGKDGTVRRWRTGDGALLHMYQGHRSAVNRVAFSPDGTLLASAGDDRTVRLWNLAGGQVGGPLLGHTEEVSSVAFRPDGRQLASTGSDSTLRLWDVRTGREITCLMGHWCSHVTGVAYLPDGARVLSCSGHPFDATVKVWNADEATPDWRVFAGQQGTITAVAFDPQATTLATGNTDGWVVLWDVADRQARHWLPSQGGPVTAVAFSPDGRQLASATSRTGQLTLWAVTDGRLLHTFPAWTDEVRAVAFSPDGRVLAAAGSGKDGDCPIKLWDAETGRALRTLLGHKARVNGLAFNKNGSRLVSAGSDGTVREWHPADGTHRLVLDQPQQPIHALALHPDDRHLATVHWKDVRAASYEVRVWDLETARPTQVFRQHDSALTGLAYSPDGRRLFTVGLDRTFKIWDTANGQEILSLRDPDHSFLRVACSADGRRVVTVGQAGEVRLWDAPMIQGWYWSGLETPRSPEQLLAWHRREAAAAEAEGQWYAAAWHLDRLLAREPGSAALRARRDRARHRAGRLD